MLYFLSDYTEGAHPKVLERLNELNMVSLPGYGTDDYCEAAKAKIRAACHREDLQVWFLTGGTQTNQVVISTMLRQYHSVIAAETGHINVHESGAIEFTGHKVQALPQHEGKICPKELEACLRHFYDVPANFHPLPGMVYISHPTEYGTIYSLTELEALSAVCRELGLYLFLDGARLGYGLRCPQNDVTLRDLSRLCDAFYIGGTKVGALFGEALVLTHPALKEDFRYLIKQHGGMLAKGRLLGVQFDALFEDGLYFKISEHAVKMADKIRSALDDIGASYLVPGITNQIFPILPDDFLEELGKNFMFTEMERVDESHRAIRFCTSWASTQDNVDALCSEIKRIAKM